MLPTLVCIGPVSISSLLVFIIMGITCGCFVFWRRMKDLGMDEERSLEIFLGSLGIGLVLGRLVYILIRFGNFLLNLFRWFSVSRYPGFSLLGFGVGFLIGIWFLTRKTGFRFWRLADEATFPLLLMGIFFTTGSFLSGLERGGETSLFWGLFFPGDMICRHPVSLIRGWVFAMVWGWLRWAEKRWRLWKWYRSQREGFITLMAVMLVVIGELLLAFLKPSGVYSWVITHLLVLALGVGALVVFFQRSGRGRPVKSQKNLFWLNKKGK